MASAAGKIHLVGSLGFQNAEITFRALAAKLGTRARRYPDGEPGERGYWIRWQNRTFAEHPAFALQNNRDIEGYEDGKTRPLYVLTEGVDPDLLEIGILGYAEEALASWNIFSELIEDGVVPSRHPVPGMHAKLRGASHQFHSPGRCPSGRAGDGAVHAG